MEQIPVAPLREVVVNMFVSLDGFTGGGQGWGSEPSLARNCRRMFCRYCKSLRSSSWAGSPTRTWPGTGRARTSLRPRR